ncbi:hypothetical protein V8E53_008131 [Lactarius tabidus]
MPDSIQNSYGAVFVGLLLNVMLTGLEIVQAWLYCWNYWDKDRKAFKIFIGLLTVMDILSTALGSYSMYWYLVVNYGNVQNFGYRLWALNVQSFLNAIPGSAVQLYYTRRVYLVSQSIIWPIIIVPLILGGTLVGFSLSGMTFSVNENSQVHIIPWFPFVWMGTLVLADILITVSMSWTLYHKRTGFARTDSMIMTLMAYTINTGFLLSTLGTAMIISFLVAPSTQIWVAIFLVMGKCYMNSLYAMLNTRDYVRDRSTTENVCTTYRLSSIRLEPPSEAYGSKSRKPDIVTVHRSTTSDPASKSGHSNL